MGHINNTSKPLVFVGTNISLWTLIGTCEQVGYTIAGVIDDDYHGQGHFQGIPVIAKEQDLETNKDKWSQYQFLCTANWQPPELQYPEHTRNKQKRNRLIALLENSGLDIASVAHQYSQITNYNSNIGRGVVIESGAVIGPGVTINDWSVIYQWSGIGEGSVIGRDCVIQRSVMLCGDIVIEDDCYIGMSVKLFRDRSIIRQGTFIHPGLIVMRDTQPGEVVSLAGKDLRRVYLTP